MAADVAYARRPFERLPASLQAPVIASLAGMWISACFSPHRWLAFLTAIAFSCLWFILGTNYSYLRDQLYRGREMRIFVVSAASASILALLGWLILDIERAGIGGLGYTGLGMTSILVAGVGLGHLHAQRSRWWFTYLIVIAAGLVVTFTRGAWLGFALMLTLYAWSVRREFPRAVLVFLALVGSVAVLIWMIPFLREYVLIRFAHGDNSRFGIWATTINIIRHNLLVGVGPGVHPLVYNSYLVPGAMPDAAFAHNFVLAVLADLGLIGGIPFLTVFFVVFLSAVRLLRSPDFQDRGLGAGLIGVFVHLSVDIPIYGVEIGGLFWVFAFLACIRAEVIQQGGPETEDEIGSRVEGALVKGQT